MKGRQELRVITEIKVMLGVSFSSMLMLLLSLTWLPLVKFDPLVTVGGTTVEGRVGMSTGSAGVIFLEKMATRALGSLVNIVLDLSMRKFLGQSLVSVGKRDNIKHRILTFLKKEMALYSTSREKQNDLKN